MSQDTYASDLALLRNHAETLELTDGQGRLAIVPDYQGRAMTSTLAGEGGRSFGWLNREFIASGTDDATFNNYGGEDRFWLGPEAGQFGLWFREAEPFDLDHWRTPAGFNAGPFNVTARDDTSVTMARSLAVTNRSGAVFDCVVERTVRLLDADATAERLRGDVGDVRTIAFESENVLANAGETPWTRDGGLLSIWILGQFKPLARGVVIVPLRTGSEADFGPAATTKYFGPIPPERCTVEKDHLLFACDGRFRSKIGVSPRRSRGVLGSYDPDGNVLTIVQFNQPLTAAELPYVNSLWELQDRPFSGDAINSYNDGEAEPGAGQLGPFYEIETSSPAAVCEPGQAITHVHRTFHFAGETAALGAVAERVLGVALPAPAS